MRYPRTRASAVLALTLLAAGCGSATGSAGTGDGSGKHAVNIAYISYGYNDFIQSEEKGLKDVVEGDGGSVRVFNANFDAQKLVKDCQDAVSSGHYNAVVLAPVDPATGKPCAAAAAASNVPVVTIEGVVGDDLNGIEPQVKGVVGAVAITPQKNADAQVSLLQKACSDVDPCKVIAEVASPSDPLTAMVVQQAKKLPHVEVVQTLSTGYDPAVVAKEFPDALTAHPDANVFVSISDSQALAVMPALKSAGLTRQIKVIGNGGSRLGAKAVADGTLYGTVGSWPQQMGKTAAEMLSKAVNGEKIEEPGVDALALGKPLVLTKDNIAQFTSEWGAERP